MNKTFDLRNPTPARRLIHTGFEPKPIEVPPGATLSCVALKDHVASKLKKIMEMAGEGEALIIADAGTLPVAAEPEPSEPVAPPPPVVRKQTGKKVTMTRKARSATKGAERRGR